MIVNESTVADFRLRTDHTTGDEIGLILNDSIYVYDSTESSADDGNNYIKPDDVTGAGRWVKNRTYTTGAGSFTYFVKLIDP